MAAVRILGGGPAGAAAAIAALAEGSAVEIVEQSRFPRHKVCGEFLSPEIAGVLERLGAWDDFAAAGPSRIERAVLHFGRREKRYRLPEPAFGLSRYTLDRLLLERAVRLGARVERARSAGPAAIVAAGRSAVAPRGHRLFGFKAHFRGPVNDAVELFFFDGAYAGVSPVESGITNVCGLAPEGLLRARGFDFDSLLLRSEPLAERTRPLSRATQWFTAGPVVFDRRWREASGNTYRAGDALAFIDPFTGSGILNAMVTGRLAGIAAARGTAPSDYLRACRRALERPLEVAALFRAALERGWGAGALFIPGQWLFRLTRPTLAA